MTKQDLEAIINSLVVAEGDLWADLQGEEVAITLSTAMDMPMAMAKAATIHQEIEDIKEEVGMAEELAIITHQTQPIFAVAKLAT